MLLTDEAVKTNSMVGGGREAVELDEMTLLPTVVWKFSASQLFDRQQRWKHYALNGKSRFHEVSEKKRNASEI